MNQALLLLAFYPEEELESQSHDDLSGRLRLAIMLYPSLLDLFDFDKVRGNWTFCQGDQSASRSGGMSNLLFTCLLLWSDQCYLVLRPPAALPLYTGAAGRFYLPSGAAQRAKYATM